MDGIHLRPTPLLKQLAQQELTQCCPMSAHGGWEWGAEGKEKAMRGPAWEDGRQGYRAGIMGLDSSESWGHH